MSIRIESHADDCAYPIIIPPAWTDVHIATDPNARRVAVGKDAKGRVQSRYSEAHTSVMQAEKFARLGRFEAALPTILQRIHGDIVSGIHVFMHTNPRRPELPQYSPGAGRELLMPTSFTPELIGEAMRVLAAIYKPGYRYIKAGVLCLGLVPDAEEKQASLFRPVDPEREEKERRLMEAVDKLNL